MQFCSQLGVSMLSAYCCFYVLFRLLGCAPSKINTIKNKLYFIHMKINTASHRNPGKSSYPLPPRKQTLSARHALNTARIAPRPRPVFGRPSSAKNFKLCSNGARTKRCDRKQTSISLQLYRYIFRVHGVFWLQWLLVILCTHHVILSFYRHR